MKRWSVVVLIVLVAIAAATSRLWTPPLMFTPAKHKQHPPNNDPWKLVSYDPDNPYGTYLGNGFISTRIMGDGVGSQNGKPLPCYMAGLYDNEKLIPTPTWSDLRFYDGKKQFKIDKTAPYRQVLDMKTGILTTYATWRAGNKTLKGKIEIAPMRSLPNVGVLVAEMVPNTNGAIRVQAAAPNTSPSLLPVQGGYQTKRSRLFLAVKQRVISLDPKRQSEAGLVVTGQRRKTFRAVMYASLAAATEMAAARATAAAELAAAMSQADRPLALHKAAWAKLWEKDIIIDGPAKDQQAIHSCMFYLLESVREGSRWSIPPMGLSNNEFGGHVFWDADVWMFPALILQHPELARAIVDYRCNTLAGATANAKADGCQGAEYAWESGYSGREDIAPGLPYRHERHINGDVALAQWQYYLATGDNQWLKTRGYPVLKATADYWVSRVTYNKAKDHYEILKVVPPDENAEIVNNSVYTNAIAQMNLRFADKAAGIVGVAPNPKWSEVANKMYIPYDAKAKRFISFDDYKGYPAKQADTELLAYPLQFRISGQDMTDIYKNTFRFYQPKVLPNGPAMSSSAYAVIAARLGDCTSAYKFWRESYAPYLRGPFNYFNEKRSRTWEQMCFLTGAAGPIQSALFGLAGAHMDYDNPNAGLTFNPCLPRTWKSLKVTGVHWRGRTFDLLIKPGSKPAIQNSKLMTQN